MTFAALLTKELRSRLRRERTAWVLVAYVLLMGLIGVFFIMNANNNSAFSSGGISNAGVILYIILSSGQMLLTLFITPAYTATAINGEKERQTFDLLVCSQLTAASLLSGKLVAGLVNALLLVAVAIPLFSLVFFFGGISLLQFFGTLLVYTSTALFIGTIGLFWSTLLPRPAMSTAVTYLSCLFWIISPAIVVYLWFAFAHQFPSSDQSLVISLWNPAYALVSTFPGTTSMSPHWLVAPPWLIYVGANILVSLLFFLLCVGNVKPMPAWGRRKRGRVVLKNVPAPSSTI